MNDKPKLRWHQLSLRTVMAATTATAIGLGMRSSWNFAWLVTDFVALFAVFVMCECWTTILQSREAARQREFWRSFEKTQEEFRNANP